MRSDINEVPEIISKFLEKVSDRSDLVYDTNINVSSIGEEVKKNLRANRNRKTLNCEFTRKDSFVGIRFPGQNYNEYRAKQLKELTELLGAQRRLMESEPKKIIESRKENVQENWRKRDNTTDDVNLNKIYSPVRNQSCSTNWRTEHTTLVPKKNKETDKCEDHHKKPTFPSKSEFKK